jgi:hypothetical protein
MPSSPFLRLDAFDQIDIDAMGKAYSDACAALGLRDKADQLTELVASHIIDLAQRGILSADELFAAVIREFRHTAA